jgi:hypothetical protein
MNTFYMHTWLFSCIAAMLSGADNTLLGEKNSFVSRAGQKFTVRMAKVDLRDGTSFLFNNKGNFAVNSVRKEILTESVSWSH